jgi:uncharacterized BrkB/YihY/UPF0761 family membrane protein
MGAALSYYSVFSIGPLILIAVAVAGLAFGREAVQRPTTRFVPAKTNKAHMAFGAETRMRSSARGYS